MSDTNPEKHTMQTATNDSAFAGSVPENYQRYLVPLIFEEYARDIASRVRVATGGTVLETACGTGVVTRELAAALASGVKLIATDFNEPMIEIARSTMASGDGAEFRVADATDLPFDDDSFDAVVCQFGVMFFPDVCLGYREAARVLKAGGSFIFSVWDSLEKNPMSGVVYDTLRAAAPKSPPEFLRTPFGYHDLSLIKNQLQASGFGEIEFAVLPQISRAGSARDAALAFAAGSPAGPEAVEKGLADGGLAVIERAIEQAFGPGAIEAPMQAIAITARGCVPTTLQR